MLKRTGFLGYIYGTDSVELSLFTIDPDITSIQKSKYSNPVDDLVKLHAGLDPVDDMELIDRLYASNLEQYFNSSFRKGFPSAPQSRNPALLECCKPGCSSMPASPATIFCKTHVYLLTKESIKLRDIIKFDVAELAKISNKHSIFENVEEIKDFLTAGVDDYIRLITVYSFLDKKIRQIYPFKLGIWLKLKSAYFNKAYTLITSKYYARYLLENIKEPCTFNTLFYPTNTFII